MNSGFLPQRGASVAPCSQFAASSAGPLRPVSGRSYQSTARTPSASVGRFQRNRENDEEALLQLIDECERLTRDFNMRVAVYREKLRQLGDVGDGITVREETRQQRQRGMEAAKIASIALSPHIKSSIAREEFDRIFVQLTGCMEHFLWEMKKGVFLIQKFPFDKSEDPNLSLLPGLILTESDHSPSSEDLKHMCSNNYRSKQGTTSPAWSLKLNLDRKESRLDSNEVVLSSPTSSYRHVEIEGMIKDIQEIEKLLRDITNTDLETKQKNQVERATPSLLSEIFQPTNINKFRRRLGLCCCVPPT